MLKNSSAALEKLNRCLDGIKELMSASKIKLNPDKIEFIVFGSKRQGDKLKGYFPSSILIFPCPNMFRMSAEVVLCNSMILDMSDGFLLMRLQFLWPILLLVVSWTTVTHISGVFLSSIFINYIASKTVQPESYQIPADTLV